MGQVDGAADRSANSHLQLRRRHPGVCVSAIDYDPGASEVNQLNRLKLLLASARESRAVRD